MAWHYSPGDQHDCVTGQPCPCLSLWYRGYRGDEDRQQPAGPFPCGPKFCGCLVSLLPRHRGGLVFALWLRGWRGLWRALPGPRLTYLHSCRLRQGAPGTASGEGRADCRPHAALLCLLPQPSQGVLPARQVRAAPRGLPAPSFLPSSASAAQAARCHPNLVTCQILCTESPSHHRLTLGGGLCLGIELQGRRGNSGWGCLRNLRNRPG